MKAIVYKSTGSWYVVKTEHGQLMNARIKGIFKIDGFTFIPELRFDSAKKEIWVNDKGAAKKGETSFILAAVYKF